MIRGWGRPACPARLDEAEALATIEDRPMLELAPITTPEDAAERLRELMATRRDDAVQVLKQWVEPELEDV